MLSFLILTNIQPRPHRCNIKDVHLEIYTSQHISDTVDIIYAQFLYVATSRLFTHFADSLVMFRHKNTWFGLKYLFWSTGNICRSSQISRGVTQTVIGRLAVASVSSTSLCESQPMHVWYDFTCLQFAGMVAADMTSWRLSRCYYWILVFQSSSEIQSDPAARGRCWAAILLTVW